MAISFLTKGQKQFGGESVALSANDIGKVGHLYKKKKYLNLNLTLKQKLKMDLNVNPTTIKLLEEIK